MAFDPNLADAISRVRFLVGDMADPTLMPGGEGVYTALLQANGTDEALTAQAAARGLASYYATQPDSVSSSGESVSWSSRIAQWNRVALGTAGGAAGTSSMTFVPVVYRVTDSTDEFSR